MLDILNSFLYFVNYIFSFKIYDSITILDLIIFTLFLSIIFSFLYITIKGRNK